MVTITEQNETKSEFVPGPGVYEFDDLQEVKSNLESEFDAEEKKLKFEDNLKMVILNKYFQRYFHRTYWTNCSKHSKISRPLWKWKWNYWNRKINTNKLKKQKNKKKIQKSIKTKKGWLYKLKEEKSIEIYKSKVINFSKWKHQVKIIKEISAFEATCNKKA